MNLRLRTALVSMNCTYRLWVQWKDSDNPTTRGYALKAKTYGLIAYDRVMGNNPRKSK